MRKMRRFLSLTLPATLLFGSMTVNAASPSVTAEQNADYMMSVNHDGAPNWFNGEYYSDSYADLKTAFGTNENALYNHSLQCGFNESRLVTPVLDVVKYRANNPDLQNAFGDNWELYVRHYFEYGITEGRNNFTDFDAETYLSMYTDLQNAFGTDLGLATIHYIEFGLSEGREYKWPEPENTNNSTLPDGFCREDFPEGGYREYQITNGIETWSMSYDAEGALEQEIAYNSSGQMTFERNWSNGEIESTRTIVYNENGLVIEDREQASDGSVEWWEYEYDSNGREIERTEKYIDADGVEYILSTKVYTYDPEGRKIREDQLNGEGDMWCFIEYTYYPNGIQKTEWGRYSNGSEWYYVEYDENGDVIVDLE